VLLMSVSCISTVVQSHYWKQKAAVPEPCFQLFSWRSRRSRREASHAEVEIQADHESWKVSSNPWDGQDWSMTPTRDVQLENTSTLQGNAHEHRDFTSKAGLHNAACSPAAIESIKLSDTTLSMEVDVRSSTIKGYVLGADNTGNVKATSGASSKPIRCRVKGNGFRTFELEVAPSDSICVLYARITESMKASGAINNHKIKLSFRCPSHGGVVNLDASDTAAFAVNIVPDRTTLNVQTIDVSAEVRALHAEAAMLQWEDARLRRELRGLHVLIKAMSGIAPSEHRSEPELSYSLEGANVDVLRSTIGARRAEIQRLAKELSGMEALIHRLSTKKSGEQGQSGVFRKWRGPTVRGTLHRMPPDGACLFHSLAYSLPTANASSLREEICTFIEQNPTTIVAGKPLQDWVLWDSGLNHTKYAADMRAPDKWGGPIEMAVCSFMKHMHVHVYQVISGDEFQRLCAFEEGGDDAQGVMNIVYWPGHFDVLDIISTSM